MEALWFGIPEEIEMSTVSVHGEKEEKNHVSKHINIGQHTVYTTMILLNSTTQVLTGRDIVDIQSKAMKSIPSLQL